MKTIPLTQNQVALVDDEDFEQLSAVTWHVHVDKNNRYAKRNEPHGAGKQKVILMHRELTKAPPNLKVDHKNGNGLDNQKGNLRLVTRLQNCQNRKKHRNSTNPYKGIQRVRDSARNPWKALIKCEGTKIYLGTFPNPIAAAVAYDVAAIFLHGEFARLNFPGCYT